MEEVAKLKCGNLPIQDKSNTIPAYKKDGVQRNFYKYDTCQETQINLFTDRVPCPMCNMFISQVIPKSTEPLKLNKTNLDFPSRIGQTTKTGQVREDGNGIYYAGELIPLFNQEKYYTNLQPPSK